MILSDELVHIKLNNSVKSYYSNLGYDVQLPGSTKKTPGYYPEIAVKVSDIPKGSAVKVPVRCDYCYEKYFTPRRVLNRGVVGKDSCKACRNLKVKDTHLAKYGVTNPMKVPMFAKKVSGANNYKYNVNKTSIQRLKERKEGKDNLWRKTVYIRDNYTCQVCNAKSISGREVYLIAHHIEAYNTSPKLRYDINNGVTLCQGCHMNFHKLYGFGHNTKEQFFEYKANRINDPKALELLRQNKLYESKNKSASKGCYCVELDTVFESLTQASIAITGDKKSCGVIGRALKRDNNIAYGYTWRALNPKDTYDAEKVAKLTKDLPKKATRSYKQAVQCLELDKKFASVSEANSYVGVSKRDSQIMKAINNNWKAHGYTWAKI